ncbi:MAG: pyridoxamine 5'-phosphate oxidase [Bacteroidota bacterium]
MKDISAIRKDYTLRTLNEQDVAPDPMTQFSNWFSEAVNAEVNEPNAMHLATATPDGRPSGRVVLLKGLEDGAFTFYTNFQSHKGKELEANPLCCLTFFWPELERQVRIEGTAARVADDIADGYYNSRPLASRIGAWASPQSAVIAGRDILESRYRELEKKYATEQPLRPKQWGGYSVTPSLIEFWQGRAGRLHDRLQYSRTADGWQLHRLAP